tara:strand:+ start:229 stop:435 length:207 start_codon:yes stop_codon:yes gene_type:complete
MKIIKFQSCIIILLLFTGLSFADDKNNCSNMESDTGVKMYKKIKCKMGQEKGEGLSTKIKNIFKKKNY